MSNEDCETEEDYKYRMKMTNIPDPLFDKFRNNNNINSNTKINDSDDESDNETVDNSFYKCTICEKLFSTNTELNRHLNKKNPCGRKGFKCDICNKIFRDNCDLGRHLSKKNSCNKEIPKPVVPKQEKPVHNCNKCKKSYTSIKNLENHSKKCGLSSKKSDLEMELLRNEISKLKKLVQNQPTNITNITNNTQNNIQNNIQNIYINVHPYGNESMDHISNQTIIDALKLEIPEIVPYLTQKMYEKPENRNAIRKSENSDEVWLLISINNKKRWIPKTNEDYTKLNIERSHEFIRSRDSDYDLKKVPGATKSMTEKITSLKMKYTSTGGVVDDEFNDENNDLCKSDINNLNQTTTIPDDVDQYFQQSTAIQVA
jgi:uncharacterized C2H2 Zn-finger protein